MRASATTLAPDAVLAPGSGADAGAAAAAPAGPGSLDIRAEGLRKNYGSFAALDGVSLDVRAGEFLTLLGPSGSGKTTLLNIIAGFVRPDAGSIAFGGEDVTATPVHRRGLGIVFQSYALFPHKNVHENIAFPLRVRKLPKAEVERRVRQALELVQLASFAERSVAALSGGQRQRVALARAVVFSPRIVLMDEPLSALDKNLREQMQVEIRHLHERIGATTLYVTHDQREALTMSDRVAVMNQGRIEQCDTPQRVYEQPASAFVAAFIGETTLLAATALADRRVRLADGTELAVAQPLPASGGALQVALRAERLLLPGEHGPEDNQLPATITDVIYQGDSLLVLARLAGGAAVALRKPLRGGERLPLAAGDAVVLGLAPAATIVVSR